MCTILNCGSVWITDQSAENITGLTMVPQHSETIQHPGAVFSWPLIRNMYWFNTNRHQTPKHLNKPNFEILQDLQSSGARGKTDLPIFKPFPYTSSQRRVKIQ